MLRSVGHHDTNGSRKPATEESKECPERTRRVMNLLNLPPDLSRLILDRCEETDLAALRGTCKNLKRTVCRANFRVIDFLRSPRRVRWAVKHLGMPLNAMTFALAAKTSNLSVLKTLRSMRCGHDSRVCMNLARRDHLAGLQWARKQGFTWNFLCCAAAVDSGSACTVRWLEKSAVACPCKGTYHAVAARGTRARR